MSKKTNIAFFGRGEDAPDFDTGDLLLTHGQMITSKLVRFGQRLRFRGEDRKYAYWSHVAIFLNDKGDLAEALLQGVVRTKIESYRDQRYYVIRVNSEQVNRERVSTFLESVLGYRGYEEKLPVWPAFKRLLKYQFVGGGPVERYGVRTVLNVCATYVTGWGVISPADNTAICSGLGAEASVRLRGDIIYEEPLYKVSPASIAKHFGIEPINMNPLEENDLS